MSDKAAKNIFYTSLIFLLLLGMFSYGFLVGAYNYWPHDTLVLMKTAANSFLETGQFVPKNLIIKSTTDEARERFTIYDTTRIADGYYVFMGWDKPNDQYMIWLYDNKGVQLHSWPLNYAALDDGAPTHSRADSPHGLQVLPDGSVIVNFDKGKVMARLDVCSKPIWIKDGIFHHSLDSDENGHMWTWRADGTAYGDQQYLTRFDPVTGKTLQEISLIEEIIKTHGEEPFIFAVRPDFEFRKFDKNPPPDADLFHPNDIEVLPSRLADKFPEFAAGDLLISFRNLNLVAILDPESKRIKWWERGPWKFQHDPDFTVDGKISVLDNNTYRNRSEILTIDPATRKVSNNLLNGNLKFYTESMGNHQYLPNGNILVVSSGEGRIIEVTATGDTVFEFNNIVNEQDNAHVENGVWLAKDFFTTVPHCATNR
jgi:hypothetical protein